MQLIKPERNLLDDMKQNYKHIRFGRLGEVIKGLLYGSLSIILFFNSCEAKNKQKSNLGKEGYNIQAHMFDKIIEGLGKNYVVNLNESNKVYLLSFYAKTEKDFQKDSLEYSSAVHSLYRSDSSILSYLVQRFDGDTGICTWIYSHHPHSSNIKPWELTFTKEQGAVVLVHDYLMYGNSNFGESITTSPEKVEKIINKVHLNDFADWLSTMKEMNLEEVKRQFRQQFFPD